MKNERKKNSLVFAGCLVVGGVIGGVLAVLLLSGQGTVQNGVDWLRHLVVMTAPVCMVVFGIAGLLVTFVHDRKAKMLYKSWDQEDDTTYDEMGRYSSIAMGSTAVNVVLSILLFGIFTVGMVEGLYELLGLWGHLAVCIGFMILVIGYSVYQRKLVDFDRILNPEKKADAFDIRFQKKYLSTCDEQERKIIGEASYKSFRTTGMVYIVLAVVCIMGGMFLNTGVMPILVLGATWLTQNITYLSESMKLSGYRSK